MLEGGESQAAAFHCKAEILKRLLDGGAHQIQNQTKRELDVDGQHGGQSEFLVPCLELLSVQPSPQGVEREQRHEEQDRVCKVIVQIQCCWEHVTLGCLVCGMRLTALKLYNGGTRVSQINRYLGSYHPGFAMDGLVRESRGSYFPRHPAKAGVHSSRG